MNLRGYKIQTGIPCCANCDFGGYLGDVSDHYRMAICEINGECEDSNYTAIAVEPLAICDAWKPIMGIRFKEGKIEK